MNCKHLGEATRADEALAARIRHKYKIKNTTGYSLNALVDFEDPIDILAHLMIGSEGTLGFISRITYQTVPEDPFKASALVFFPSIEVRLPGGDAPEVQAGVSGGTAGPRRLALGAGQTRPAAPSCARWTMRRPPAD